MSNMFLLSGWFFSFLGVFFCIFFFDLGIYVILFDLGGFFNVSFLSFSFIFDWISCSFCFVLCFMVSSVFFFCISYMSEETKVTRFVFMVYLFVSSMLVLIVSSSFMSFLVGWDGLGFTSFLLVAWFGCSFSRLASVKTFLVNRLGDSFFVLSLVSFFIQGQFNFFTLDWYGGWVVILFLILAAFTKSAQFPFSSWLPAAMAAPTPVSSLVHSSTLVTAGIYFLIRFSPVLDYSFSLFISVMSLFTMLIASICAVFEMDTKKIVAYSTLSQLGLMGFCIGLKFVTFGFCYLLLHACFKALMFISVGIYMAFGQHFQDIRGLNSMWGFNPVVFISFLISVFSLSGIPVLSLFLFKDLIIFSLGVSVFNFLCSGFFVISVMLTGVYSFRLMSMSSFSKCSGIIVMHSYSVRLFSFFPLFICSTVLGWVLDKKVNIFFQFTSLQFFYIFTIMVFGVVLGFMWKNYSVIGNLSTWWSVSLLVFCSYMNNSLKYLFFTGSDMYKIIDQGVFNLGFVERLSKLVVFPQNSLYFSFSSVSWLGLLLFSYISAVLLFFV